jgi:hypothetical protein
VCSAARDSAHYVATLRRSIILGGHDSWASNIRMGISTNSNKWVMWILQGAGLLMLRQMGRGCGCLQLWLHVKAAPQQFMPQGREWARVLAGGQRVQCVCCAAAGSDGLC